MLCNFCNEPLCACKNTEDKPQFKANPFNKFYISHFDPKQRDDEMLEILQMENPVATILWHHVSVIGRCFCEQRCCDKSELDAYVNEEDEIITFDTFKKPEMLAIYYNLYRNNSGVDNPQILRRFPSFETIDLFREYIIQKCIVFKFKDKKLKLKQTLNSMETSTPLSSPPSTPTNGSIPEPSEPPRITRPNRNSSPRGNGTISFRINTAPLPQQNIGFTQYDNEDLFVRVDDILAMRERWNRNGRGSH